MSNELKKKQSELDALEQQLIENKATRLKLNAEAKELRSLYFEVQEGRERLLHEALKAQEDKSKPIGGAN